MVKESQKYVHEIVTCLGFEPGACIYPAALTTESSQLVKLRKELLWCQLGQAIYLPRLEIMTGQMGKKKCMPKKRRVGKNEGTKIRPSPVYIIPRVLLLT